MSTLKTHNLQSPDAGSVNIAMTQNAGMVVAGLSTYSNQINVGSNIKLGNAGVITATSFVGAFQNSGDFTIDDYVVHAGDTNTKFGFPAADTISAETAGSERLRINSSGRVLIGTTNATTVGTVNTNLIVGSTTNNDEVGLTLNVMEGTNNRRVKFFLDDDDGVYGFDTTSSTGTAQFVVRHATSEKLRIDSAGDVILKNNGGDNRIERDTTSGGPYLLFHNRGSGTTDSSGVYNMGGISAAGYRDVANPGIVGSIQFERQPTAGGASSGCDIVFRTGFNGTSSHTGISETLRLTYGGHLLPGANNQYDLGSTAKGWRNVYMNDLNLSNMNGDTNDVDGTQGSWTIQEGKDDLYIINRLNGKKFKIKMEEIS